MKTKFFFLALAFPFYSVFISAQCKNKQPITNTSVQDINSVAQLQFINRVQKNKLDTLVAVLTNPNIKHIVNESAIVNEIGQLKTKEAYRLLYTCCCRKIVIEDLNEFNMLVGKIKSLGGYQALNKYFLNSAVSSKLKPLDFNTKVIQLCTAKEPVCYSCAIK